MPWTIPYTECHFLSLEIVIYLVCSKKKYSTDDNWDVHISQQRLKPIQQIASMFDGLLEKCYGFWLPQHAFDHGPNLFNRSRTGGRISTAKYYLFFQFRVIEVAKLSICLNVRTIFACLHPSISRIRHEELHQVQPARLTYCFTQFDLEELEVSRICLLEELLIELRYVLQTKFSW